MLKILLIILLAIGILIAVLLRAPREIGRIGTRPDDFADIERLVAFLDEG